jgi:hypothetical protein
LGTLKKAVGGKTCQFNEEVQSARCGYISRQKFLLMVRNPVVIEVWIPCLEIMETVLKNDTVVLNLSA